MNELLLIRHPAPDVAAGLCYGRSDVPCVTGEIEKVAPALLAQLPARCQLISSPLQRCEQLAQYLSRQAGDLPLKTDARLMEMNFGRWEMQPWDSIARSELQAWTDDFAHHRCGGTGESTADVLQRVHECLAQTLHEQRSTGVQQVWVTHAGVMRAALWLLIERARFIAKDPAEQLLVVGVAQTLPLVVPLHASDWPKHELPWGQLLRLKLPQLPSTPPLS